MAILKRFFVCASLLLISTSNSYAIATFGAYTYGTDLDVGNLDDGGIGFETAFTTSSVYQSQATIGNSAFTPILKAYSTSADAIDVSDSTRSRAQAYQIYTSTIDQLITLAINLDSIVTSDITSLASSSVDAEIRIYGGSDFIFTDVPCRGQEAFGAYMCGTRLATSSLGNSNGSSSLQDSISFNVLAGEQFSVYGSLIARSRDGTADAFNTLTMNFMDTTAIESVATVPVPAAIWLFGSGVLALVGIGRRKRLSL